MRLSPRMLHVGVVVRILRLAQSLTIPQLAAEAGINPKTLSKLERGESNYTQSVLGAIARALGCPNSAALDAQLDDWCSQRIGPRQIKSEWHELIALWEQIAVDAEARKVALGYLRLQAKQVAQLHHRSDSAVAASALRESLRVRSGTGRAVARRVTVAAADGGSDGETGRTSVASMGLQQTTNNNDGNNGDSTTLPLTGTDVSKTT